MVAPYSLLVPVVGMGLAAAVLGERPSPLEIGAAVVIIGGVLLGTPRATTVRDQPVHSVEWNRRAPDSV
ncbi:hypothetical protein BJF78_09220 [Pseudonocardia sp. CNS-139]|nr:hypothetical protein BJF78_09220 [Pseudonocardia sp. CNS-139]